MLAVSKIAGAVLIILGSGCSALINPEEGRLGGGGPGTDGGPVGFDATTGTDGGVPPGDDGGVPPGDDGGVPPGEDGGPVCTAEPRCVGGDLVSCTETVRCPLGCLTSEPGPHCAVMVPSNVESSLWDYAAGDVEIEDNGIYDTSVCGSFFGARVHVVSQPSGPELCVLSTAAFRIVAGRTLRVTGERALVVMATDEVRIDGVLDVAARGATSGPGGFGGGTAGVIDGEGPAGGIAGQHQGTYADGGGGGGGLCGRGGRGGDAPAPAFSTNPDALGGEGGGTIDPTWELEPLFGGSGGGRGRGTVDASGTRGGLGGAGGGALQISSLVAIRVGGQILAGGGGGQRGLNRVFSDNWGSGGGAGSGGAVLLEAPEIRFEMPTRIAITGGGGGAGVVGGIEGEDGEDGYLSLMGRPSGGTSASTPTGSASDGGDGAGGDALTGDRGLDSYPDGNAGGGGGGAGCALFRALGATTMGRPGANPADAPAVRTLELRVR